MSQLERIGDIDLAQDLGFQKWEWRVERVGWAVVAAIVLAALLGVFGVGVLATASAEDGPLTVDYERITRFGYSTPLLVDVRDAPGEELVVGLERDYVEELLVTQITPEPDTVSVDADRVLYTFKLAGASPLVAFETSPQHVGPLSGEVALSSGESVTVTQFVFP